MSDNDMHTGGKLLRHTRRDHLKLIGGGTALAGLGSGVTAAQTDDEGEQGQQQVTVSSGTNVMVTPSPDGESIVMDLHGILFHVPRDGGQAEPLTEVEFEPTRPDYGPNGNRVAVQAYREGNYDIWTMAPDGSDQQQVTEGFYDDREPKWSPNGSRIAFSSDRGGSYDIWTVDVESGEVQQWTDDDNENYEPTWSPNGSQLAYVRDGEAIEAVDENGNRRELLSAEEGETFRSPSWTPEEGEETVAYVRKTEREGQAPVTALMVGDEQVTEGEDVFIFTPDWLSTDELLYTADGSIRVLNRAEESVSDISFEATFQLPSVDYEKKSYDFDDQSARNVQGILSPRHAPDGARVAFVALNDLWVMSIGESPRRVTDDSFYKADPAWSPDGRYVVYSSDETGTQDLFIYDTEMDTYRQLTDLDDAVVAADWSPDGDQIAVQNQDRDTLVIEVDVTEDSAETGEMQTVVEDLFLPGRPTWSSDGSMLALGALDPISDRFREGTSKILTVDIESGEQSFHPPGEEFASLSTRNYDGPVWSPDGNWMAFVVESTLRVMPVTEDGEPDGPAEQITDEATDAPTWSGDSEWLLYLNNGQLKRVRRDGSETQEISTPELTYQRDQPEGETVVYAGQMWDGTSEEMQENVTIRVVNSRIKNVEPNTEPPRGDYVDASDLTVIPGLWDTHVHYTYSDRYFGNRIGRINLAYGITSTISNGDRAYNAIEQRESLQAGARMGPRFFAAGEPVDGSRVFYGFIGRPTTSFDQVDLEMSRAIGLDYDSLLEGTYVRLNARRMDRVADIAQEELGVPVASHYMAPGLFVGMDGTSHLTGTQKTGYARTVSETSQAYDDISSLYGEGERAIETTLFTADFLLADEFEDDPRLPLFLPWESGDVLDGLSTRADLLNAVSENTEFPSDPNCQTETCRFVDAFKRISDCGGTVLAGTDMPLDYVGTSLHSNLRGLAHFGFSPYETLLTATRLPAEFMGVEEDIGTLESGKLADMAIVEGNPLEQVSDAMRVQMTMKNGELLTLDDMLGQYAEDGEAFAESENEEDEENEQGGSDNEHGH